jgi:hypothetical protein
VSKWEQAQRHRHRARHQHEHRSNDKRGSQGRNQGRWRDEQTQHQEEDDLAEPGKGIKRLIDDLSRAMAVTAEDQTHQIDGQKPACANRLGTAEEGGSTGESQNGIQPGRRFQTIDESEQQIAAADAEGSRARNFPGQ